MRSTLSFFNLGFARGKIVSYFSSIVWYHRCGYSYIVGDFLAGFSNVRNYSSQVLFDSTSESLFTEPEVYNRPTIVSSYCNASEFAENNVGSSPQLSAPRHWLKNWQEERVDKLTASTFSQAIGFFSHRRVQLWLEKLGAIEPFPARRSYPGYYAALWSISNEKEALETYAYISGNDVLFPAFQVYGKDEWLGASPDGMIYRDGYPSPGVLEIKCPYFGGDKRVASPWKRVPVYYIPQAQGLMEILDSEWMDLFVWTLNGCSLFRINRNREYWSLLNKALSDFWWDHVQPAKYLINDYVITDPLTQLKLLQPTPRHDSCKDLVVESRKISDQSKLLICTPK